MSTLLIQAMKARVFKLQVAEPSNAIYDEAGKAAMCFTERLARGYNVLDVEISRRSWIRNGERGV